MAKDQIRCNMCTNSIKEYITFTCSHFYCNNCVNILSICKINDDPTSANISLTCCNEITSITLDILKELENSIPLCEQCCERKFEKFCTICDIYWCNSCLIQYHDAIKMHANHQLLPHYEICCKMSRIEHFCADCNRPSCKTCITSHLGHNYLDYVSHKVSSKISIKKCMLVIAKSKIIVEDKNILVKKIRELFLLLITQAQIVEGFLIKEIINTVSLCEKRNEMFQLKINNLDTCENIKHEHLIINTFQDLMVSFNIDELEIILQAIIERFMTFELKRTNKLLGKKRKKI